MFELGRIHTLMVDHVDGRGAWLQAGDQQVLLPKKEVPPTVRPGDRLSVFVYAGPSGQPVATRQRPKAQVGEFASLMAMEVGPAGAFLDWGLEKELLVPFRKQPEPMHAGRFYLVKVCLDREGRAFGNGRIDSCLETEVTGLKEGQEVMLTIWQLTDLGAKVIVNNRFSGLLYREELGPRTSPGDRLTGYIKRIRDDGKVDVTLRQSGAAGVEADKATLLSALRKSGFLPLHDNSPPESIRQDLGMSKKSFKKAAGGLYKEGVIELTGEGIRLKKKDGEK